MTWWTLLVWLAAAGIVLCLSGSTLWSFYHCVRHLCCFVLPASLLFCKPVTDSAVHIVGDITCLCPWS